jgi:hypothetical protein
MYIGEFQLALNESWPKNSVFDVTLWSAGAGNSLVPVLDDQNHQKVVQVMNVVGTFGYKSAVSRYCMVTEINNTYWAVSAEC